MMYGLREQVLDLPKYHYQADDYGKGIPRWCPGCGDHAVLRAVQKLCEEFQLPPEDTVVVSGIGCSSRFPHYMNTYGFHSLHGRAFPVACGIKFRRPDLHVLVITGDGDCCSIGAGAWIHAIRYNMHMVALLLDNEIYGLTKKQTSPTSRRGTRSNTHPYGSVLPPINPIQTTLGVANVSFVAQTTDLNPPHLYATIKAAFEHPGFSFVRILQRCPAFMAELAEEWKTQKDQYVLLTHENGIPASDAVLRSYRNQVNHDPSDIIKARALAEQGSAYIHLGLFYQNPDALRYDKYGAHNLGYTPEQKAAVLNAEFDRFAV